jgi:hypothetical protein
MAYRYVEAEEAEQPELACPSLQSRTSAAVCPARHGIFQYMQAAQPIRLLCSRPLTYLLCGGEVSVKFASYKVNILAWAILVRSLAP